MNHILKIPQKKLMMAGLIVGTLDILAAFADAWFSFHSTPEKVLNGIAAATIGKEIATGSIQFILLGILIHYFIAFSFTFFFWIVYPLLKKYAKNNLLIGILYGIFIWAAMRFLILPLLSQIKFPPFKLIKAIKPMLILIGAIGIPLSFIIRTFYVAQGKDSGNVSNENLQGK